MASENGSGEPQSGDLAAELAAMRARNEALEVNLKDLQAYSDRRAIDFELRAEAIKRGIVDLDGLRLIDADSVSIDASGAVLGVQTAVTRLRRDKPWLFGGANSSSAAGVPAAAPARQKQATEMTLDEWRQARAELLRRR